MAKKGKWFDVFLNKTATGYGTGINVDEYDYLVVQISGADDASPAHATGTIKCEGSVSETEPTWATASGPSNVHEPKYMYNLDTGTGIQGSTGVAWADTNKTYEMKINVDTVRWVNFNVSAYTAGKFTVRVRGMNINRF